MVLIHGESHKYGYARDVRVVLGKFGRILMTVIIPPPSYEVPTSKQTNVRSNSEQGIAVRLHDLIAAIGHALYEKDKSSIATADGKNRFQNTEKTLCVQDLGNGKILLYLIPGKSHTEVEVRLSDLIAAIGQELTDDKSPTT